MAVGMPFTWTVTAMAPADLVSSDCPGNVLAQNRSQKYSSCNRTKELNAIACSLHWLVY